MALMLDILHASCNDGPGLRTTVFLKGCPLKCAWCHNPESQNIQKELSYNALLCSKCGACEAVCKNGVHRIYGDIHEIDRKLCTLCGACVLSCMQNALEIKGRDMTALEVFDIVKKDKRYYDATGGGVTVSGGEPLLQSEFCIELFKLLHGEGINTAIETCGFCKVEVLLKCAEVTDIFLFDYKATNGEKHKKLTGVDNALILDNLALLDKTGANIILRCPLVFGVNDDDEHLAAIAKMQQRYKSISAVEIMPYHDMGAYKNERIGKEYVLCDIKTATEEQKAVWRIKLDSFGGADIKIN